MSSSTLICFVSVNAKCCWGVSVFAKSAANTSTRPLCAADRSCANCSSRSLRRAVSTRFVPPAANSRANATPIPALAPVTSAHFPAHGPLISSLPNKLRAYHGLTIGVLELLSPRTQTVCWCDQADGTVHQCGGFLTCSGTESEGATVATLSSGRVTVARSKYVRLREGVYEYE